MTSIGAAFCDAAAVIGGNAKLGIVCAMDVEMQGLLDAMRGVSVEEIYGFKFYEGVLEHTKVVLVRCGIGKVNAARGTQLMIDKAKLHHQQRCGRCAQCRAEAYGYSGWQ